MRVRLPRSWDTDDDVIGSIRATWVPTILPSWRLSAGRTCSAGFRWNKTLLRRCAMIALRPCHGRRIR